MLVLLHDRYTDGRLEVSLTPGSDTVTVQMSQRIFQCPLSEWQKLCAAFTTPANNTQKVNEDE